MLSQYYGTSYIKTLEIEKLKAGIVKRRFPWQKVIEVEHIKTAVWVWADYEASWKKALSGETRIKLLAISLNGMFGKTETSYQKLNIPSTKHDGGSTASCYGDTPLTREICFLAKFNPNLLKGHDWFIWWRDIIRLLFIYKHLSKSTSNMVNEISTVAHLTHKNKPHWLSHFSFSFCKTVSFIFITLHICDSYQWHFVVQIVNSIRFY